MRDELPDVPALRTLEPPPGGLARLRARLDDAQRPRATWWHVALPVAVAATLIVWLLVGSTRPRPQPRRVAVPVQPAPVAPPAPLVDEALSQHDDVQFYWVASRPGGAQERPRAPAILEVSITDAPRVTVMASR